MLKTMRFYTYTWSVQGYLARLPNTSDELVMFAKPAELPATPEEIPIIVKEVELPDFSDAKLELVLQEAKVRMARDEVRAAKVTLQEKEENLRKLLAIEDKSHGEQ